LEKLLSADTTFIGIVKRIRYAMVG
jgi:hypothetical protein